MGEKNKHNFVEFWDLFKYRNSLIFLATDRQILFMNNLAEISVSWQQWCMALLRVVRRPSNKQIWLMLHVCVHGWVARPAANSGLAYTYRNMKGRQGSTVLNPHPQFILYNKIHSASRKKAQKYRTPGTYTSQGVKIFLDYFFKFQLFVRYLLYC